jgi:hypothetical protein
MVDITSPSLLVLLDLGLKSSLLLDDLFSSLSKRIGGEYFRRNDCLLSLWFSLLWRIPYVKYTANPGKRGVQILGHYDAFCNKNGTCIREVMDKYSGEIYKIEIKMMMI